jgi:hypothetical protein
MPADKTMRGPARLPQSLLIAYLATVAAFWTSTFFPEARLWGGNWYQFFSWYGPLVLMAVSLAALFIVPWLVERGAPKTYATPAIAALAAYGVSFVLLRGQTHFLGDGLQVLAKVQTGAEVLKPWDRVTWYIQKAAYLLVGGSGEGAARLALQGLSVLCGLVFLLFLILVARRLFRVNSDRLLFIMSLATGGYMLLYYGYIENYPLFVLAVSVFGLIGLMALRGLWSRWWLLLPLVTAPVLHPFGTALIPAAVYIFLRKTGLGRRFSGLRAGARVGWIVGPVLLFLGAIYYLWSTNYFFRFSLVPPVADQFTVEGYTLFSVKHLLDYANQIVMLFPGLLLALAAIVAKRREKLLGQPEIRFLLLLTVTALGIVFIFNPRLGMPRDWDLFSFAGPPLVMLATWIMLKSPPAASFGRLACGLSIALGMILLAPRVVSQAHAETSIAVFDRMANLDVVKSRNGRFLLQQYLKRRGEMDEHGRRVRINSAALPHENLSEEGRILGDDGYWRKAIDKFKRAIAYDPSYHYAWANLGVVYRWMERYDSALICLRIADGLNP